MAKSSHDGAVIAVDQGTSSTKVLAVGRDGSVLAEVTVPVRQSHPQPGWVEQDADEIFRSVSTGLSRVLAMVDVPVLAIGLSTQRESAVAWSRVTGQPVGPVLGWQDRRTADRAEALHAEGHDARVRALTGLPLDPMFSALKFGWLLDSVDADRARSTAGDIVVGTVDAWLLYKLTGEFRIEVGNASRTLLVDVETGEYSDELLGLFGIPRAALPTIVPSLSASWPIELDGLSGLRVHAVLGDSHAALFAHGAREAGAVKVTYGTGSSIMGLERDGVARDSAGVVRTIAWAAPTLARAFEGNILSTGATLVWLGEVLGIEPAAVAEIAREASADHGINLVPAFAGLGAPWWNESARAVLTGMTLGTGRAEICRAAVESIVLQIEDVLSAADAAAGQRIETVMVDGGPARNDWLLQLQADLSQRTVVRTEVTALSALGAAQLAGIGAGAWTWAEVDEARQPHTVFTPAIDRSVAADRRRSWLAAVATATDDSQVIPVAHSTVNSH